MNNEFGRCGVKIQTILGIDVKTIYEELTTALGSNAPSYCTVLRWASHFCERREDVNDDLRSARPVSELTGIRQIINNDPRSSYDEIIAETSLSHGTIERITQDCLKMKKMTSHQLDDEQK